MEKAIFPEGPFIHPPCQGKPFVPPFLPDSETQPGGLETNLCMPTEPAAEIPAYFDLMNSDATTPPTRDVLQKRLDNAADAKQNPPSPTFFNAAEWETLQAVCACALPLPPEITPALIASAIDKRLAGGKGDGWRYDALPPDGEAFKIGLQGVDATATAQFGAGFAGIDAEKQSSLLTQIKNGQVGGPSWNTVPPKRFWEELLAEMVEGLYSHPIAQASIGYIGFADAKGWTKIGLNMVETPHTSDITPAPDDLKIVPLVTGAGKSETPDPVDAVVIGTGAGGAPLLASLARAGLKVVALEAGAAWNPPADFPTDERAQEKLFWRDERLSAGANPLAFGNNNSGAGVGGSTLHYTAYTPRPHPDDFTLHTDFGVGVDWPLSYADLEPYLGQVETFLGVSGPNPYPWGGPRTSGYALPPLPLNAAAQLMERACKTLGITTSPAPNAALSKKYYQDGVGWRPACTNRGFCQAGCSVRAKASMDVTYLPVAVHFGAEIRPECFVTKIERDTSGAVSGVVYLQNGQEVRQATKNVFLCAGAIETPRLLLLNDMGNGSGQVGRNFMAHPGWQVWGQFDESTYPHKGIPGGLISEDTHRPKDADFAGGYLLQSIGVMPVTYVSQMARATGRFGDDLKNHMEGYNHVAGINILGDGLPYENNYMELSDEKDARGFAKPRIYHTAGENEKRMNAHADKIMRQIWQAAGAKDVWSFERYAHIIGTCRMGDKSNNSVVSTNGAVWDVPGLYICDNSVFPSALSVNPALTIMALALRTAERFLAAR